MFIIFSSEFYLGGDILNSEIIGKFISEQRKKLNLTQKELADKLNITSQAISKWENGRGLPDIETLKLLSEIFQIDIKNILEGQEPKPIKPQKSPLIYIIVIIVLFLIAIFLLNKNNETFSFYPLATDNHAFSIKGVIAYNSNKKSIYISEVNYSLEDEEQYKSIECILYESNNNIEKKISQWGEIDKNAKTTNLLTELLHQVEFNIDNYECSCTSANCNNLYLRINALNKDNKIISYNIALQIDTNCTVN